MTLYSCCICVQSGVRLKISHLTRIARGSGRRKPIAAARLTERSDHCCLKYAHGAHHAPHLQSPTEDASRVQSQLSSLSKGNMRIATSVKQGRFVVAMRIVEAGTIVFEEVP